jgi:glycosyltransferase involved in cell wall biosynthesis
MTRRVAFVEWLGGGGIAQTTHAFADITQTAGHPTGVLSREAPYFDSEIDVRKSSIPVLSGVHAHLRQIEATATWIEENEPQTVLVQNYLIPLAEQRVFRAARRVGARTILVVHNHVPHSRRTGTSFGLAALLRSADTVVVLSSFVGRHLSDAYGVRSTRIEHPAPLIVLRSAPSEPPELEGRAEGPMIVVFGGLRRSYKGIAFANSVIEQSCDAVTFVAAGIGASSLRGGIVIDRFLPDGELLALLRSAHLSLHPYRQATQSGAVVAAQHTGAVPMASAVGGLPEQIQDGSTGFLMRSEATPREWSERLQEVASSDLGTIRARAQRDAARRHKRSSEQLLALLHA